MHDSIDSLPLDALVQILCKLNHAELEPLLLVNKSFHDAALVARHLHFDFSTPAPSRKLQFSGGEIEKTPVAPSMKLDCRKAQKPKLCEDETKKIAVVLFPLFRKAAKTEIW